MKYTNLIKLNVLTATNAVLCYLRKLPVVGKFIPEKVFGLYKTKRFLAWLGVLWDVIKSLLVTNLAVIIFIQQFPRLFLSEDRINNSVYTSLYILILGVGSFLSGSSLFKSKPDDYMFIHHFMINPEVYYKYKIIRNIITDGLFTLPALVYTLGDLAFGTALMLFRIAVLLGTNAIYLAIFKRKGKILNIRVREWTSMAVYLAAYAACFAGVLSNITYSKMFYLIVSTSSVIVFILSFIYVARYDRYGKIAIKYTNKGVVKISVSTGQGINEGENGLKSLKYADAKKYFEDNKHKSMTKYLDDVFRFRYRKAIREPIINNLVVQGVILAIIGCCVRTGWIPFDQTDIFKYSPILISLTLMCSYASTYAHMYFRNIDSFVLKSRMATQKYVRETMLNRYARTLFLDVFVFLSLIVDVTMFILASGIKVSFSDFAYLMAICPPVLIIQDTYEWLIYFMIQPYALDVTVTVKSPAYKVAGYLSSLIELIFIFIRTNITKALPEIALITACAVIVYVICSNFAYKTFKLRL